MNVTIVDAETGEMINEFKEITSISGVFMTEEGMHALSYIQATNVDMVVLLDKLMDIIDEVDAKRPGIKALLMLKRLGALGEETKEGDDS
jgi:hypothetical protein